MEYSRCGTATAAKSAKSAAETATATALTCVLGNGVTVYDEVVT